MNDRLHELHGRLNQVMSTKSWLDAQSKTILAEIDEIEREMQAKHRAEQEARLQAMECKTGGCDD